jgi:tape measure domain-containing protein
MSLNLQQLRAVITADDRDYQRGMQRVERRGQEAARNVKRSFEGMTIKAPSMSGLTGMLSTAGGNLVADMLKGVASGFTAVQRAGIDYNRTLETSTLAFETLIGSAAEAKKHIAALEKLAIASPFETSDLVSASLQLQAFGADAKQVLKDLPAIGDAASVAAAGTGNFAEALQGTVLALGQMRSTGKLSLEEINQLTTRGVAALDILERKTGRTKAQIRKDIESGRVSGAGAASLLVEGFREAYGGTAERLGGTVAGKESTLADKFKQRAAADKQAFEAYRLSLDAMIEGLDSETAKKVSSKVDSIVGDNIQFFTELFSGKITAEEFGKNLIPAAKLAVKDFGEVVTGGLQSAWETTKGAVSGVAKGAGEAMGGASIEGAKKMLGIESPSRVFMELGALSMEGFALGLESKAERVWEALGLAMSGGRRKLKPGESHTFTTDETRQRAEDLLKDPRVRAMLDTISKSEGANYNTLFGGGTFDDFSAHPDRRITRKLGGKPITSTAAGRYQFLSRTWRGVSAYLGLDDFSPHSQDLAAVELMRRRGMISPLFQGDVAGAFRAGNREWASLPGSPYGQPTKSAETLAAVYAKALAAQEKLTTSIESLTAPVAQLAQALAPALPVLKNLGGMKAGAYDPALAIRGLDGPQASPFSALQQMVQGGEIITDVVGQLDRVPFAEASKELGKLDLSTTRARAALGAMNEQAALSPPLLNETAKALEKVSNGGKRALDEYFGQASDGERWKKFGQRFGDSFDQSLGEILNDPANWKDALRGFASNFFNDLFSSLQQQLLTRATGKASFGAILGDVIGSFLGGFLGGGGGVKLPSGGGGLKIPALNINPFLGVPGRAAGGPVSAGKTYLVGEEGPELFTAEANGRIIPNGALAPFGLGGSLGAELAELVRVNINLGSVIAELQQIKLWTKLAGINSGLQMAKGVPVIGKMIGLLTGGVGSLGGFAGAVPGFAAGGDFTADTLAMVGENGPELVRFNHSGRVYSNAETQQMMSGAQAGKTINVVNHFHISAPQGKVSQESQHQIASKVGAAIMHALKRDG